MCPCVRWPCRELWSGVAPQHVPETGELGLAATPLSGDIYDMGGKLHSPRLIPRKGLIVNS